MMLENTKNWKQPTQPRHVDCASFTSYWGNSFSLNSCCYYLGLKSDYRSSSLQRDLNTSGFSESSRILASKQDKRIVQFQRLSSCRASSLYRIEKKVTIQISNNYHMRQSNKYPLVAYIFYNIYNVLCILFSKEQLIVGSL